MNEGVRASDQAGDAARRYAATVVRLRTGERLPAATIDQACLAAGKSVSDLAVDLVAGVAAGPRPGSRCPACESAILRATSTKRRGPLAVRYCECPGCGFAAREILNSADVRRRKTKPA